MNFLPNQYLDDKKLSILHNYLTPQFSDYKKILKKIEKVIKNNDFTLGKEVDYFEDNIKKLIKQKYVVAVGSGTDALMLSLKCLGVHEGDEVITTPYTFYATVGAIVTAGAIPKFVDVDDDYNINPDLIERAITKKTKAILPVHWSGRICKMDKILKISKKYDIPVVEDSCHAIEAKYKNKFAGTFGEFGCFSLHPLKNLNVWGDGGYVVIKNKKDYKKMLLMRNHGLIGRNKNLLFGYNSRLDTIQAVVANHLLKKIKKITSIRIKNSFYLEKKLKNIKYLNFKTRHKNLKEVFHLYEIRVNNSNIRNKLVNYLRSKGIDAKIHYPVPMHLQPASKAYNLKRGMFLKAEEIAKTTISLPVHEFLRKKQLDHILKTFENFFK
jgi:dTDP-3-amino-2,3,6-trideoxy-4-keto-D-glucose/dTDP-3-amino-3,4,6-trideoxy-alpha-D-glucose/dTDP-2,6-dideoxy-D-kanosamine transaminase